MELLAFCILYLTGISFFIFLFLFGELPVFEGTPLPWLQWLISAAPCEALCWLVRPVLCTWALMFALVLS